MNQFEMLAAALIIALIVVFVKNKVNGGRVKMTPEEAKRKLETEEGVILLDVRTREEYVESHIPKSTLIPLDDLSKEAGSKLPDKNAEIMVYCLSGGRSAMAVRTLSRLGYTRIYNLGGIMNWPYEKVSGSK